MELKEKCPVCDTKADTWLTDHANITHYKCPRCGNFYYVWTSIDLENKTVDRPLLSHWLRTHQSKKPIELTKELVNTILTNTSLPKPKEQADNFILWMGNSVNSPEEEVMKTYNEIASIIGATHQGNVRYIITHLNYEGIISTDIDTGNNFQGSLTFEGWERFYELEHSNTDSKLAFMGMQFDNSMLTTIFNDVIKKAVTETGYDIRKLDEEKRAGSIDDKLRVEIRRSRFLISDLTDDNNGAYWEAGFAEGLGMPVIYICEESKYDKKKTHFDTNHHLTLMWKDDEDSLKEFAEELKATIRETLPDEADMEDE